MSQIMTAFSFITFYAIFFTGLVSASVLLITPQVNHGEGPHTVNITCQSNNTIIGEKAMNVQLQILKDGKPLALIQRCSSRVFVSDREIQAEGRVDHDDDADNHSYLTMTIDNASTEDEGEYTCVVHYRDDWRFLKMTSASQNFTLEIDTTSSMLRLMNEVTDLKTQLENMKRMLALQGSEISFTAGFDADRDQVKQFETVIFRDVISQDGDGYDETTGVFTAPRDGVYSFHLTITTGSGDNWINIDLVINQDIKARLRGGDYTHYDQSTVSAVVRLEAGDTAKAHVNSMHPDMNIYRFPWSVFSGYLLRDS